ncbi:MAG: sugar ABC transporter permease [Nitriliruptor sp.]|nr:MAG: sugar ABC transporter permease [Nitriliruptor sp.]
MSTTARSVDAEATESPRRPAGPPGGRERLTPRRWLRELSWRYVVGVIAVTFALFPAVWVISAAFNPTGSLAGQQLIPDPISTVNFETLFARPFGRWFANSMIVAVVSAGGTVFLTSLSAYVYSRMQFTGRQLSLIGLLLLQMLPQFLAIIALFLIMIEIGRFFPQLGLNSLAGLIMIYLGGALGLNTWLMKGFFDSVPRELDESALVDGASHTQVFFRIVLPLVKPILAIVGLFSFVIVLNDFIVQSILLRDETTYTLPVGLYLFIAEDYGARWGPFAAGALLAAIPVVALFLALQRFIVSGLTAGAVKG